MSTGPNPQPSLPLPKLWVPQPQPGTARLCPWHNSRPGHHLSALGRRDLRAESRALPEQEGEVREASTCEPQMVSLPIGRFLFQ